MAIKIASLMASIGADISGLMKGLSAAETAVKKSANNMEKSGGGFDFAMLATGMNQALEIASKLGDAISNAYAAASEGAAIEYSAIKFDNLSRSIGTTSELMLGDLKNATRGMMTDAQLMGSAGDLMALGLAKSHDEVVRLTTVSGALGMNMNQLVLALTNQTTARFDQLGVSVDGFKEKVKSLEESGMSANDAFKEAFLQQAEDQIARVGSIAETSAGKLKMMESAFGNLGDAIKLQLATTFAGLAPIMTEIGNSITENIEVGQDYKTTMNTIQNLMRTGLVSGTQYTDLLREMGVHSGMGAITAEQHQIALDFLNSTMDAASESAQGWADANDRVWVSTETTTESIGRMTEAALANQQSLSEWRTEIAQTAQSLREDLATAYTTVYEAEMSWRLGVSGTLKGKLDEEFEAHRVSAEKYRASLDLLDQTYGTNYVLQYDMELAIDDLFKSLLEDPEGFVAKAAALEDYFMPLDAAVQDSMTLVGDLQAQLTALEKTYTAKINIVIATYGSMGNLPVGGGEGEGGNGGGGEVVPELRATGGYSLAGQPYIVGEAGPELFVPDTNGRVYSNTSSDAMLGATVTNNYNLVMPTTANPADIKMAFELMEAWNG
jgi:hypothetical protein